jgi:cell division control protein 7
MQQLLSAIAYVHSYGIIHRDVNPSNFLFNKKLKQGKLIDFGLADIRSKSKIQLSCNPLGSFKHCSHQANAICINCLSKKEKKATRRGTSGYRAPEVLLQYQYQTSAIDVWSCGVILLSLLSKKYPFFTNRGDSAALIEVMSVFGSSTCVHAANQIGIVLTISDDIEGGCIDTLCTPEGERGDLVPLVLALLDVNCLTRSTAEHALHTHFCIF